MEKRKPGGALHHIVALAKVLSDTSQDGNDQKITRHIQYFVKRFLLSLIVLPVADPLT